MGILDTLKGMFGGKAAGAASGITDKANDAIDAAADKADSVTGTKLGGAVDGAADKAKDAVGDVADKATE